MLFMDDTKVEKNTETNTVQESTTETNDKSVATKEIVADKKPNTPPTNKPAGRPGANGKKTFGKRPQNGRRPQRRGRDTEFEEKVIDIARVTTVVKGGRRFSFSCIVVVGNKKGKVGWGHGKAKEVPDSIKKAMKDAKTRMINVPIIDKRTVPHEQLGKFLASSVLVKPAPKGKGIIASGAIRTVVELAGYHDIYTKSLGSRSKTNSVKAVIDALSQLRTIEEIAKLRDLKPSDILK